MALPTLAKTWNFSPNFLDASSSGGYGYSMYHIKTQLITLGSNPWTVVSSSDGISSVGPGDYWTDPSKCNTHNYSGNRSWIVLQQTAMTGGTFQMLLSCHKQGGGNPTIIETYFSQGGLFTGGTLSADPTATDGVHAANGNNRHQWWDGVTATSTPCRTHIAVSDDGLITRWWTYVAGYCPCFFSVEQPKDAVSGWANPWLAVACVDWYASTSFRPDYASLNDVKSNTVWWNSIAKDYLYLTSEGHTSSMLGQIQTYVNDLDSSTWPFFPIGLYGDTVGYRGRHGGLTDLWWGSTTRVDGDHYPADTSRQFAQVGDLVVPWLGDGTIMQTA